MIVWIDEVCPCGFQVSPSLFQGALSRTGLRGKGFLVRHGEDTIKLTPISQGESFSHNKVDFLAECDKVISMENTNSVSVYVETW